MVYAQAALLAFEGDQIELAYTTFSKWLSVEHDRKGAQMGSITYSNGAVSFSKHPIATRFVMAQTGRVPVSALLRRAKAPTRSLR
jgi:hypothetical protein